MTKSGEQGEEHFGIENRDELEGAVMNKMSIGGNLKFQV